MRATSSSIGITYAGAPPCSGPDSAPTADDSAAPQSAPVDAITRAVNVEAFSPCSAVQIQYVSIALTCFGSASPRQRSRNFSATVEPRATTSSEAGSTAVGDGGGARDDPHHLRREPTEVLARLLVRDLVQLAELPLAREPGGLGLEVGRGVAGQLLELARLGVRHRRLEVVVDQQPPDVLVRVAARRAPRCRSPRYRSDPPVELGLGDLGLDGDDALETRLEVDFYRHGLNCYPRLTALTPDRVPARMAHRVTLIPGDGTGPELTEATRRVLEATGVDFDWDVQPAGADVMHEHGGNPLPETTLESIREHGVALKGPITTPVGGGFRSVNVGAAQEPRPLRAGAPVQELPGRALALRGRRPRDRPREHRGPLRRDRVRAGNAATPRS